MNRIMLFILLLFIGISSQAQQIVYSEMNSDEDAEMDFTIIGKSDSAILIYKKIKWKHFITGYDQNMQVLFHQRLSCLPDKPVGVDFFLYRTGMVMMYQQEKKGRVYCYGQKLSLSALPLGTPLLLDSTKLSITADEDIYSVSASEDKQKLLVFKSYVQQGVTQLVSKLFDKDLNLLDSSRKVMSFESKKIAPANPLVSNQGQVFFSVAYPEGKTDANGHLKLFWKKQGMNDWLNEEVDLKGKFILDAVLKMDERNNKLFLAAPYMDKPTGKLQGLFVACQDTLSAIQSNFIFANDSIRSIIAGKKSPASALEGLVIKSLVLKKSGGCVLTAEKIHEEVRNDNRYPSSAFGNYPYVGYNYYNPYYLGNYYRAPGYYSSRQSKRYFADDILLMNLDSNLNSSWMTHIPKRQYDEDNENRLSYCNLVTGSGIHFYFIEDVKHGNRLSDQLVQPDGILRNAGLIKASSDRYDFLPKLAKQIGARELVIPCDFRGNRVFAKLILNP